MSEKKSTYPRYVSVYDVLLRRIQDGAYTPGTQLPGENDLSREFGVSRNTLRQALLLLHEDGYVMNIKGKGTFVQLPYTDGNDSLETIPNPMVRNAIHKVDRIETEYSFRNISDKNRELFGLDASNILVFLTQTFYAGEKRIGCSLVLIPYIILQQNRVPISEDEIASFYTKLINDEEYAVEGSIRVVTPRSPVTELMGMTMNKETLFMFDDILYDRNHKAVLSEKLFMIPDEYNIFVRRKADRR